MKHRVLSYLTVVAAILLMASCASRRSLERSPMVGGLTGEAYVEKVIAAAPEWKSVTGKVALNLVMGDKGKAKVNATVCIRKGEVIQFSIAPLLGIEVARMEITPEGLLLIDRMNKRFVRATKNELKEILSKNVEFSQLEKLLTDASKPGGKTELSGKDLGIPKLEKAKVQLYDFSTKELSITPTEVTSRYRQVSLEELMKMLVALL